MAFNPANTTDSGSPALSGIAMFLQAFGQTYNDQRNKELAQVKQQQERMGLAQQELQKFQLDEYTPIMQKDVDSGKVTQEQLVDTAIPTYSRELGVAAYVKKPKEYAPKYSTPEQILAAKNALRDDINKRETEMWSAFPVLSNAKKELSSLGSSDKILEQGTDKSKWYNEKVVQINQGIQNGTIPAEMKDTLESEIKNMITTLSDYKWLSERQGNMIKSDRQGLKQGSPIRDITNKSAEFDTDLMGAKQALQQGVDKNAIISELKKIYGDKYDWESLLK